MEQYGVVNHLNVLNKRAAEQIGMPNAVLAEVDTEDQKAKDEREAKGVFEDHQLDLVTVRSSRPPQHPWIFP